MARNRQFKNPEDVPAWIGSNIIIRPDGSLFSESAGRNLINARTETSFNFVIPDESSFSLDDDGQLVIVGADKKSHVIPTVDPGETPQDNEGDKVLVFPMTVKDKNGTVYKVEKVTETVDGQEKEVVKATKLGTIGVPLPADAFDTTMIAEDMAIVRFYRGNGRYSFDTWQDYYKDIQLIRVKYQKLGSNYYAAWKLLPGGESDEVSATIQVVKSDVIDPKKVIFITKKGTRYDFTYVDSTYTFSVTSGPEGDVQELYALHPKGDGTYYTLGKLSIATYARQEREVVLVAVENTQVDYDVIERTLHTVYDSVGIHWTVHRDAFPYTDDGGFMANATGLSTYNDKMRALNAAYRAAKGKDFKPGANYIFFLKATGNIEVGKRELTGFMPRGAQFGYIFTSETADAVEPIAVAHELGHGRWKLYHPFDKNYGAYPAAAEKTNNLMAYGNGPHIAKWQWDQLADPALVVNVFQGDERSYYEPGEYFTKLIQQIRCAYVSGVDQIDMPIKYQVGGNKVEIESLEYGLGIDKPENGLKLTRAWWTARAGNKVIKGILNPQVNEAGGLLQFGGGIDAFTIQVPAEVYRANSGVTQFEHFRRYLLPSETDVTANFERIWGGGIKLKIEAGQKLSSEDMQRLKTIASCETKYLNVDSRYKLIQAIMEYGTSEPEEDLLLDVMQTIPAGNQSRELFEKINGNIVLLDLLVRKMDNLWGEERNFERLAVEYFNLFNRGYSEDEWLARYRKLDDAHKLVYFGEGDHCAWQLSTSRDYDQVEFSETQIYNFIPAIPGTMDPERQVADCDVDHIYYSLPLQDYVAVLFVEKTAFTDAGKVHLLPVSVYYMLAQGYWNDQRYAAAQRLAIAASMVGLDEFWLLGKAWQYGSKTFRALRLLSVKKFAKIDKIKVPLDTKGEELKNISGIKLDDYVEWGPKAVIRSTSDIEKSIVNHLLKREVPQETIDRLIIRAMYVDDVLGNNRTLECIEALAQNGRFLNPKDMADWFTINKIIMPNGTLKEGGQPARNLLNEIETGLRELNLNKNDKVYISKVIDGDEIDVLNDTKGRIIECKRVIGGADALKQRTNDIIRKFRDETALSSKNKNAYKIHYGQIMIDAPTNPFYNLSKEEFVIKFRETYFVESGISRQELKDVIQQLEVVNGRGRFTIQSIEW